MKASGCVLVILLGSNLVVSYTPEALNYVLRTITYLKSVKSGALSCVFYDVALQNTYDNILDAILKSPQMDQVAKYVISGSYHDGLQQLPWNPSLLLIDVGNDGTFLKHRVTLHNLDGILRLFNPTTKVLIFVDLSNEVLRSGIEEPIASAGYRHPVFMDDSTMRVLFCYSVWCWYMPQVIQPIYLFEWGNRWIKGRNITYIEEYFEFPYTWNYHWMDETARYLDTEASEYQHPCKGLRSIKLTLCLEDHKEGGQILADIILLSSFVFFDIPRNFQQLFTGIPIFSRIVVPKDRPLNIAELLILPFTWQLWLFIAALLVSSEMIKNAFPKWFKNDPFLLAVCGFERHDLHQASRYEKVIFLSLIVVMFFLTSAYETKIVSLMVERPAVQRIKTVEDLHQSDLKFYIDLESCPHYIEHPIVGKMVAQRNDSLFAEKVADACILWQSQIAEAMYEVSYDYDNNQPFYVMLDYEIYEGPELFTTSERNPLLEVFRHIHHLLVEAGIMTHWKLQWKEEVRFSALGRRSKMSFAGKVTLDFDDMISAWMIVGIGLGVSVVGFLSELITKRL